MAIKDDKDVPQTVKDNVHQWLANGQAILDNLDEATRRQQHLKDLGLFTRKQWNLLRTFGGMEGVLFSSKELRRLQKEIDEDIDLQFGFTQLPGYVGVKMVKLDKVIEEIKLDILAYDPKFFINNPDFKLEMKFTCDGALMHGDSVFSVMVSNHDLTFFDLFLTTDNYISIYLFPIILSICTGDSSKCAIYGTALYREHLPDYEHRRQRISRTIFCCIC
jgi:hypothetical protein